jgi:hypothetical protein
LAVTVSAAVDCSGRVSGLELKLNDVSVSELTVTANAELVNTV